MAKISLADAFVKSGVYHEIKWADKVIITLDGDYLPFEHQYNGTNLCCEFDRAGLFDEAGTGKTMSLHMTALYRIGCGNKVIALMPPALLRQFYEELHNKFVGVEKFISAELFQGTKPQRQKMIDRYEKEGWPDLLLMTYDLFRGSKPSKVTVDGKVTLVSRDGYHARLKKEGYAVIIADEAQALNNPSSRVHKKVYSFIGGKNTADSEAALVLSTATSCHSRLEQCYGLIRLKSPKAYGTKAEFERLHVNFNPNSPYREVVGYSNLDVLIMNLYSQARRVEKKDVAPNMPDKINTFVNVVLDPAHFKLYRKLLNEKMLELEGGLINALQKNALRQIALQLVSNPNEYSDTKIKNNMEEMLALQLDSIDLKLTKVFILAHYNTTIARLMEFLKEYNPVSMNSHTANKEHSREAFLHNPDCRIMIAHPKSGGAGLNLQSVCSNVIFYECPDSPGDITQASERVHRIVGTDSTVNIYYFSPERTWAATKIEKVAVKALDINKVVGDQRALMDDLFI
jgi:SNF2 family DNA or RNA helicase